MVEVFLFSITETFQLITCNSRSFKTWSLLNDKGGQSNKLSENDKIRKSTFTNNSYISFLDYYPCYSTRVGQFLPYLTQLYVLDYSERLP